MLGDQFRQLGLRTAQIVARLEWIDRGGFEQLAGAVDHCHLHAGADAGIQPHRHARAGGRGEQQVLQVAGEYRDGFLLGTLAQFHHQVQRQRERQLHAPGPARHFQQPGVGRRAAEGDRMGLGDQLLDGLDWRDLIGIHLDVQRQDVLVAPAHHRQRPMAGHRRPAFLVIEVVGELRTCLLLALGDARTQHGVFAQVAAQPTEQFGVLGEAFHQDVARAFQRGLGIGHLFVQIRRGGLGRNQAAILQQRLGQRPQAFLACDFGACPALGLVGQVQVLQLRFGDRRGDACFQRVVELALLANRIQHGLPAVLQFTQIAQALFQLAQLRIVEPPGDLLAIARDEGDGRTLVQQLHGGEDLARLCGDFVGDGLCDALGDTGHGACRLSDGRRP